LKNNHLQKVVCRRFMGELIASAPVMVIAPRSATPPTTYERLPLDQDAEPPRRGGCATALQLEQQPSSGVSLCCRPCTPSRKRATSAWSSGAGASATGASEAASTAARRRAWRENCRGIWSFTVVQCREEDIKNGEGEKM
jgi:hypothetical protein